MDWMAQGTRITGNLCYHGARPYAKESNPLTLSSSDPKPGIVEEGGRVFLHFKVGPESKQAVTRLVNTDLLGKAMIPNLPFENPDGSPLVVDTDYFGMTRSDSAPAPGPFKNPGQGNLKLQIWSCPRPCAEENTA